MQSIPQAAWPAARTKLTRVVRDEPRVVRGLKGHGERKCYVDSDEAEFRILSDSRVNWADAAERSVGF